MSRSATYSTGIITILVALLELLNGLLLLGGWWVISRYAPSFQFARPWMLWGLFAGVFVALLYLIDIWRRNRSLARFSETTLLPFTLRGLSSGRSLLRFLFLRHAFTFLAIALAGPQVGTRMEEVKAKGVDVIIALDVSNSMMAEDLKPSRMEVARRALEQLIERMKGDRLGIVVFAGEAYTQLPLTSDRSAAHLFLSSIGPSMVSTQGTAIGAAINMAKDGFPEDGSTGKAIIVITDGENHEDDALGAAKEALEAGIVVHTVGMGTPQGAPIPVRKGNVVAGFKKDKNGQTVVSRLNEQMLSDIAGEGGGAYVRATAQGTGVDALVEDLRGMDQSEVGTYRFAGHEDRYGYFLAIACVMIFVGLLIGERAWERPTWMNA